MQNTLLEMLPTETAAVVQVVANAMNEDEGIWASTTIQRHFALENLGISDGRHYFVHKTGTTITGIVGLHHYEWGPPENVWLGWFAVLPSHQEQGIGNQMLERIQDRAIQLGYTKLFIETYSSPTFERARKFYSKQGFREVGQIDEYLSDGSSMVIYQKHLKLHGPRNA